MLTPKISGIFDCRKYDQSGKKAHDQREMLADTDNVTFSVLQPIGQVSECFMNNGQLDELARPRVSKREREAAAAENRQEVADVVSVKFKIGSNCKWFDRFARPMDRPTNEELEKNHAKLVMEHARLLKANGIPYEVAKNIVTEIDEDTLKDIYTR